MGYHQQGCRCTAPTKVRLFAAINAVLSIETKNTKFESMQSILNSSRFFNLMIYRCKMRQRDPRLFYLTMEVTVRKAGVRTVLVLDDEARPAILQACHPKGDSR